ncbi:hypothetical protein STHAL_30725 [Streptomyces halstedii]|uniref:Uncharacterized protein n=1 Tax=Streptomyces halstedii TaxID=1944 RepID=A0ABS6U0U6_STRHA|nr:DUF5959 family protein [Streptomyces halstedii]MBV7673824.1 hypothetical protein [Streptomyces halstedii]
MDTNTRPETIELIRLADPCQSVSVRLRSAEPTLESLGVRYYDAEAVVTSDFVNGTVHLGLDSEDLSDWGQLLDAVEEAGRDAEQEAGPEEPFTADWPRSGRTAYLRVVCGDPYVVEVRDGTGTGVVVSVPLDMGEGWTAESRERLAAARAALGRIRTG